MKQHIMVKPDQFEVSDSIKDAAKIQALYFLEKNNLEPTKKNINKYTKNILKHKYEQLTNPVLTKVSSTVITLKCSITEIEIGYCLITSYKDWESLSILYINKQFRGFGYSQILVDYYQNYSNKIKVIELDKDVFDQYKGIYKSFGYDYTVGGIFPTSIALIKRCEFNKLNEAIDQMQNESRLKQNERFEKYHAQIIELFKHSKHKQEIFEKKGELVKILLNVKYEEHNFFKYELEHLDDDHIFRDYIHFRLNEECETF